VLAAGFIVWLGQPRTAGLYLLAFGAIGAFTTARACRGVMRRAWRALALCAAFAVTGALLVGSETFLPGCRDADAARAADAFIEAAAAGDVQKARGWFSEDASQLRPVHALPRATRARLPGSRTERSDECELLSLFAASSPAHRRCFSYGVEGGGTAVVVIVGRANCRWRVLATI
jgi:hypothetical protein